MELTLDSFQKVLAHLYSPETLKRFKEGERWFQLFGQRFSEAVFIRTRDGWSLESEVKIISDFRD